MIFRVRVGVRIGVRLGVSLGVRLGVRLGSTHALLGREFKQLISKNCFGNEKKSSFVHFGASTNLCSHSNTRIETMCTKNITN